MTREVDLHRLYARLHGPDGDAAAREVGDEARRAGARVVVVSACLLGERTRYDGGDKLTPEAVDPLLQDPGVRVLPLCPEILGGMGCPRPPLELVGGDGDTPDRARALSPDGRDQTADLVRGAERAEALAAAAGAERALLKERSPSCGANLVHRDGRVAPGRGFFAAGLVRRGLPVLSDEDVIKEV